MSRLWYWQKFAILTILFTIPVGFALFSYITQIDKSIVFTEKEIAGIQYVSPVVSLLQHMQQHRGATILRSRDEQSSQALLDATERNIREDIARIDAEDHTSGAAFQSTGAWEAVKWKWFALQAAHKGLSSEENFTRHTKLISDTIALIHDVGDSSNLILDPELPSYETMNAIVNILPALTEDIGQARAFGLGVKDPGKLSDDEWKGFINYANVASIENAKLQNDMREIFEDDPSLQAMLERPLKDAENALHSFIGMANDIVNAKKIPMPLPEYNIFMTRIIDAQFLLIERQTVTLTGLLESRIVALNKEKKASISVTAVSYLLILYFFIGFYLLVARTVREFENIAKQLVGGKEAEVSVLSNDELGEAGKSFNAIGRELILSNQGIASKMQELEKKSGELERTNQFMVGRELRMAELKKELQEAHDENDKLKGSAAG